MTGDQVVETRADRLDRARRALAELNEAGFSLRRVDRFTDELKVTPIAGRGLAETWPTGLKQRIQDLRSEVLELIP